MKETILDLDRNLFLCLNGDAGHTLDTIMWALSSKWAFVPAGILALWLIWKKAGWRRLLLAVCCIALVVLLADQISGFFKHYTPKFRPTHTPMLEGLVHTVNGYVGGWYGTVSAHAANGFGVSMFASQVIQKKWFTWVIFIFTALVAYSRIYLGVHFPMDILLGTCLGLTIGYLCYKLYEKIASRVPGKNTKRETKEIHS